MKISFQTHPMTEINYLEEIHIFFNILKEKTNESEAQKLKRAYSTIENMIDKKRKDFNNFEISEDELDELIRLNMKNEIIEKLKNKDYKRFK